MELYYIIFSLVFASCVFEFSSNYKIKRNIIIAWGIFFTLFGGLRWKIGGDWYQYYDHFLYSSWNNIFNYDRYGNGRETLEPGFVFLNVAIKSVFGEFYIYNIIICAFIQYTFYKMCSKFVPNHPLLMYAYMMIIFSSYFPVRSWLALSIAYWGYFYIEERNLKKFIITVTIATLIHNQCIIFFPFYWVNRLRFNYITFTVLFVIVAASGLAFQSYFIQIAILTGGDIAEKFYHYTLFETEGKTGANYMSWALNYGFVIAYMFYREKNKLKENEWINSLVNMAIAHSCTYMIFSEGMGDLTRLAALFAPSKAILFATCFTYFAKSKNIIYKSCSISFIVVYMIYQLTRLCDWYFFEDANVPYKTIFDYAIL